MAEVKFLSLGDFHGRVDWTPRLAEAARSASAVLLCGDLTQFGTPRDADAMLDEVYQYCDTVYAVAGNCDSPAIEEHLRRQGVSIHGRGVALPAGVGLCGVSGSNPTPFGTPLEYTEEELAGFLTAGWADVVESAVRVILHHAPPWGTTCDRVRSGEQTGVKGLRSFCEVHQPELVICGHIHEARGIDRIGETLVVNGGMAARGHGVLIRVQGDEVEVELL